MIAISYRREDSLPIAGRLYDRLQATFGSRNVFMDFDSIPPGVDFRERIKETIEKSDFVIALIGPRWLGEQNDGSRRIDEPIDFVRLEIAYALKARICVIPLLIDTTAMPKPEKLPLDIQALAFRNALPLDSGLDFHQHADRLIAALSNQTDAECVRSKPSMRRSAADRATVVTSVTARSNNARRRMILIGVAVSAFIVASIWMFTWQHGTYVSSQSRSEQSPALQPPPTATPQPSPAAPITPTADAPKAVVTESPENRFVAAPPVTIEKTAERFSGIWKGQVTTWKYQNLAAQLSIDDNESIVILSYNPEGENYSHGRASNTLRNWRRDGPNLLTAPYENARDGKMSIGLSGTGADSTLVFHGGEELGEGTFRRAEASTSTASVATPPALPISPTTTPKNKKPFAGTWQGVKRLYWKGKLNKDYHEDYTLIINEAENEIIFQDRSQRLESKGWYHVNSRTLANMAYKAMQEDHGIVSNETWQMMSAYAAPAILVLSDDAQTVTLTETGASWPPVKGNTTKYGVRIVTNDSVTRATLHRKK
ncbi:MAG: hypothetical protein DME97_06030 [Verrucomicrobia bacterium]|nr:MAG: hypothetical protein DME97_06030 [Verrucomicrobiota bacterium]